jgi:hypothetical protein
MLRTIAWLCVVAGVGCGGTEQPESASAKPATSGEESAPAEGSASAKDAIRVSSPVADAVLSSPFVITGEARGMWYFEATFPVTLLDADGKPVVSTYAQAQGEWMTEQFVPFRTELTFTEPATETGTLVLERANPSGLPEHAAEVRVPVRFHAQPH